MSLELIISRNDRLINYEQLERCDENVKEMSERSDVTCARTGCASRGCACVTSADACGETRMVSEFFAWKVVLA